MVHPPYHYWPSPPVPPLCIDLSGSILSLCPTTAISPSGLPCSHDFMPGMPTALRTVRSSRVVARWMASHALLMTCMPLPSLRRCSAARNVPLLRGEVVAGSLRDCTSPDADALPVQLTPFPNLGGSFRFAGASLAGPTWDSFVDLGKGIMGPRAGISSAGVVRVED